MEDVSNKTIVALLAIALVITVVGTVVSVSKLGALGGKYSVLSGAATTGSGTTTVTLAGTAAFVLDDSSVDFGSGYVLEAVNATLDSSVTPSSWFGWINTTAPAMPDSMLLNNTGTTPLKVNVSSGNMPHAEAWLCAGSPGSCTTNYATLEVKAANKELNSCTTNGNLASNYQRILGPSSNQSIQLCTEWDYNTPSDSIDVYFQAWVPNDAGTGTHNVRVDFTACDSTIC
jgi:hypothetical protein